MARLNLRLNIEAMCRTYQLWTDDDIQGERIDPEDIDMVEPATWSEQSSDTEERSFRINEGAAWRNMPLYNFNILQAADNEPDEVMEIIHDKAPDVERKFDLAGIESGTRDWFIELVDALAYLSFHEDKDEDYATRYWYHPWRKLKEEHPEIEGYYMGHPGKDSLEDDEGPKVSEETSSAAQADW